MINKLSIKVNVSIDTEDTKHPIIIGVRRDNTTEKFLLIRRSEIIPPSITDAIPEINDIEVAMLI